ncbi:MAG: alkaline phosphatase D family protein [Flavobacteriaceae bacterium]
MNLKKLITIPFAMILLAVIGCKEDVETKTYSWDQVVDRTWVGEHFWANRLQDWEVKDGRLVCIQKSVKKPMRTVHLVSSRLEGQGDFEMSVLTGSTTNTTGLNKTAASGFLIAAGVSIDYRAAALIHHSPGNEGGYFAGVSASGMLFIQDFNHIEKKMLATEQLAELPQQYQIQLSGKQNGADYQIVLQVLDSSKAVLGALTYIIDEHKLKGNVALVSHPGTGENTASFWFNNWQLSGKKFNYEPMHTSGPIITAQYTLSDELVKINAQLMPIGKSDTQTVDLEIKIGDTWKNVGTSTVQELSYNAPFRIENFKHTSDVPYRLSYQYKDSGETFYYQGAFRADPVDKDTIVVAGFTGNHNLAKGVESAPFNWAEQIWYPHTQLVGNVVKQEADLLFFSGDQIYEGASPSSPDRKNIYKDYMYKWYLWCWAYSDLVKTVPSITIPDDHDVFQGNVWGNGGGDTDIDTKGGYVYGAEFVKMVERTQVSHLPDPYDATPIKTGIGTYYSEMNLGRISFAIIEDRKFKSGPKGLVAPTKSGRPDHVIDPEYSYEMADVEGATLLGERQLNFLDNWASDWKGSDMKVVLSQTIFGNMATHHGPELQHLYMDFDSNGWPQMGRNKALSNIRKGFGFMLAGDQHLASIVHHGIDAQNDAGWSFCVPSIANFYPRAWQPFEKLGENHIDGLQEYTGEYLDGFGNKVNVYAHTNPGPKSMVEPAALHDRMPGYGIVRFAKNSRNITMECWPRYVDPTDPSTGKQYEGWPRTIAMEDNYGKEAKGYLATIQVKGAMNTVVQVYDETDQEVVYTLRIKGNSFRPKIFDIRHSYTLKVGEQGEASQPKIFSGLKAAKKEAILSVDLSNEGQ